MTTELTPSEILSDMVLKMTQHWDATRATGNAILDKLDTKDLTGLLTHDPEDPHGIRALFSNEIQPCAPIIRQYGEEADMIISHLSVFGSDAEKSLDDVDNGQEDSIQLSLQSLRDKEMRAVEGSKMALEKIDGKSMSQALLLSHTKEEVDQMDEDKLEELFEKMHRQLQAEKQQNVQDGVERLLVVDWPLKHMHEAINVKHGLQDSLRQQAADVTSKHHMADGLYAELLKQQADVREKKQKCSELRGKTIHIEEAKRKALKEAEMAWQKAWEEHSYAFIRREAAAMMEDKLEAADEMINKEVEAAGKALTQTAELCKQCEVKAENHAKCLITRIEASHADLLEHARPSVEEAWKNTALASELCKLVVAAKHAEISNLSEEQAQFNQRARRQKETKKKAQTLEKAEKLGRQITGTKAELAKFEELSSQADAQLGSFRSLNSGLDEAAITSYAQEAASNCYGDSKYVTSIDSEDSTEAPGSTDAIQLHMPDPLEKLRIEMEENFKAEKQQMVAEFQMQMHQLREEMRAELHRDDASVTSVNSFEKV
eukprot:CAMPEP_0114670052 /NCGR_PEP_ID=MMETSP0191-20121206/38980_1 /TAXON_ID=126664 /ORGANISM="Sorites sp." /LENGTH=544 /DNA_ID=CAMNT_0001926925 /DNA_START=63 /DNA_END=1697 /DNA_ORIENTATION=+